MTGKFIFAALLFSFAALSQMLAQCDCVTTGNCPVLTTDQGEFTGYINVKVNGPNNLALSPLTSVCITITHTWIGDLSMSLTSPSGVEYLVMADMGNNYQECGTQLDNAEICLVPGTSKPLTNNTQYNCNTAPCSIGNCCLNGNWTLPCGGVTSPLTGVPQAPNCDLNDFNIAGQPANGTWKLSILDVCTNDVGTLNNFTLTFAGGTQACYACESDGGVLDSIEVVSCFGDDNLQFELPPNYGTDGPDFGDDSIIYEYTYVVVQNDIILGVDEDIDLTGQPPGNYVIYGLSYLTIHGIQVPSIIGMDIDNIEALLGSSTAPFCGNFSDNGVPVTIVPAIPTTIINQSICPGECIAVGNQQVCTSSTIVLDSWLGCDSAIQVNLTVVQPDSVDLVATVCAGNCVTVGGQQYCPPTEQYVHLQNWQGCDSVVHLTFNVLNPTAIITPASPPTLTCTNTTVALSAATSGPGMLAYAWSGPGTFTSNQPSVSATTAGTYTVTVSDNTASPACTSIASVTVTSSTTGPDLAFNGTPPSICQGQSFDLATVAIQDLNNTASIITIHSGTPATSANQLASSTVSPTANTTYYYKATEGSCSDEIAVTLTVKPVPTANFTATTTSCLSDGVNVTYLGTAGASATYDWSFDGGTAVPGTGQGPHVVTFPLASQKFITLTVTENGCASSVFTQNITVENPLAQPVINCSSTTSTITFSWTAVSGATSYSVTSSVPGTQPTPTSYAVVGLTPGQQVTVQVEAIGTNSCGNSSAQQTCAAESCPSLTVTPAVVSDICRDAATLPFDLQATVTGGNGTGTLTWTGNGIVDAAAGTFDPSQAAIGSNNITVTYIQGNCTATNNLTINVFQTPTASLTAQSPACFGEPVAITYTGSVGAGLTANWNFSGGTATPGTGTVSQSVVWSTSGQHVVSVDIASVNGCPSAPATVTVQVDAPLTQPVINCSATTESVNFTWPAVIGATAYNVVVTTGQLATQNTPTSYTVTGLAPNEQVGIEVTAIGGGACGNSVSTANCAAQNCLPVSIDITPVADICLESNSMPVQLVATVNGGSVSGNLAFSGQGVSSSGLFDPAQANVGAHTITAIYTDGPCNYTQSITINVHQPPTGGFNAPASVCMGGPATVNFNGTAQPGYTYNWNFMSGVATSGSGSGPYNITWSTPGLKFITLTVVSPEGCISPIYTGMVQVVTPLAAPQISCDNTTTSIEFTWPSVPGATAYSVTTTTGQIITQTAPTAWEVTGLQPQEQVCVTVTAVSSGVCSGTTAQLCCNAKPCPAISVDVLPLADFCLGTSAPIQLQATVTGGSGAGIGTWGGDGVLNPSTGTFSPSVAGFGQHVITYVFEEEGCSYSDEITVGVYQQPTADFSVDAAICLSDYASIDFNGIAGADAVYTWDFGGGVASPGIGPGPHQIEWNVPGTKTVTLSVTDGSCSSPIFTQQIQVDDQLAAPTINCSATTDGVIFTWNAVPGATGYTVVGTGGQQVADTSFVFTDLDPGEAVSIQVSVDGTTACPLPSVSLNCNALPCPTFTVAVEPVSPICLTGATTSVLLVVDVTGVGLAGTGTWSGAGIIDPAQGVFDPAVAGVGIHKIKYTYQQVNCIFEDEIDIEIVPLPTADAGPDRLITCWESDQLVQLGGAGTSSGSDIAYEWTAASGSFPGPASVQSPQVGEAGVFTLTVTNTTLGCASADDVLVVSTQSSPVPEVTVEPIHCGHDGKDANVIVSTVTGGMDPYLYSLNGEPYVSGNTFPFLEAGDYDLTVMDAEGCTGMVKFTVEKTGKLDVELTTNLTEPVVIELGESITLNALVSLPESELDSIEWTNGDMLSCVDCLNPITTPMTETTFVVTVFKNGCAQRDTLTISVNKPDSPVYVPTAFSPNDDDVNDLFMIYAGPTVKRIKTFLVFDRWGERVYEYEDFDPTDPARGWNGKLDGKPLNPAVYVWFAEVEFLDGSTDVLEGDVRLIR